MTKVMPPQLTKSLARIVANKDDAVKYGAIGIDFSPNGLRMVQFKKQDNRLEIYASVHVVTVDEQRDSSSHLRTLIKQVVKENGFVGRDIVTCIPPKDVKIMMLSYLRQADKNDESLIVKRIAERIDGDIENYVIDYMMVRPEIADAQERSALVALAKHEQVVSHLEFLRKAGLKVKILEIEPTAVRRLLSVKHEHDSNIMTISMGDAQTYITVLSGRRLIYQRDIDFGEQQLVTSLCKELEIDEHEARTMLVRDKTHYAMNTGDEENNIPVTDALFSVLKPHFMALVEEVNRALIYAASETRGLPVKQVYLTNLVATWCGIENFINTLIEVPVCVLTPFEAFNNAQLFSANSGPRGAVVTGMALHGLTGPG